MKPWVHDHAPRLWALGTNKRLPRVLRSSAMRLWAWTLQREALRRATSGSGR